MAKGVSDEVKQRLKHLLTTEVAPRFAELGHERWQSAAAAELGVSQSTISRLMNDPPDGGSPDFVETLARFLNLDPATIMFGAREEVPRFRDLPGYARALRAAKEKIIAEHRAIDAWALEKAGDFKSRPSPSEVTADLLIALAVIHMRDASHSAAADPKKSERVEQ